MKAFALKNLIGKNVFLLSGDYMHDMIISKNARNELTFAVKKYNLGNAVTEKKKKLEITSIGVIEQILIYSNINIEYRTNEYKMTINRSTVLHKELGNQDDKNYYLDQMREYNWCLNNAYAFFNSKDMTRNYHNNDIDVVLKIKNFDDNKYTYYIPQNLEYVNSAKYILANFDIIKCDNYSQVSEINTHRYNTNEHIMYVHNQDIGNDRYYFKYYFKYLHKGEVYNTLMNYKDKFPLLKFEIYDFPKDNLMDQIKQAKNYSKEYTKACINDAIMYMTNTYKEFTKNINSMILN